MTSALLAAAVQGQAEEEHAGELLFAPVWFGVIALGVMIGLLALLWSFRNTLALDPHTDTGTDAGAADLDSGRGSSR